MHEHYARLAQYLGHEAMLLDEELFQEWLELLDDDLTYEVPIRTVKERDKGAEFVDGVYRMRETKAMLIQRIQRLSTGHAWAEDPTSRTLRTVGSIFVEEIMPDGTARVHSALTIFRQRAQDRHVDLIPARRQDLIRVTGDNCRLLHRRIILTEAVLSTPNLAIFL